MGETRVLILGGGAVGTMVANKLARDLRTDIARGKVSVTVLDKSPTAVNQAGFTFVPFGYYTEEDLTRPRAMLLSPRVRAFIGPEGEVVRVDLANREVTVKSGRKFTYDYLLISTGCALDPSAVPGLKNDFSSFYTSIEDAKRLGEKIKTMSGGKIVVMTPKMPIACPGAPGKFTVILDDYLRGVKQNREDFDITFLWPVPNIGPPAYNENITENFKARGIRDVREFQLERVDEERKEVVSKDGERYKYDLLVTIPPHRGVKALKDSGITDGDGWVPSDKYTLQYRGPAGNYDEVFVAGDAGPKEIPKMGVTSHFQAFVVGENILRDIRGVGDMVLYRGHMGCPYVGGAPTPASRGAATLAVWKYGVPLGPFKPARLGWRVYRMYYYIFWDSTLKALM
ncbi:MAG: FAD/NAD(P)-binding oxidoreductase [Candidatus Korarchaeota archaeon]|nr:FAD/NAD(P)-binding oxidoreductase [Candidatus Korarchaeota archaeon]